MNNASVPPSHEISPPSGYSEGSLVSGVQRTSQCAGDGATGDLVSSPPPPTHTHTLTPPPPPHL